MGDLDLALLSVSLQISNSYIEQKSSGNSQTWNCLGEAFGFDDIKKHSENHFRNKESNDCQNFIIDWQGFREKVFRIPWPNVFRI